MAESLYEPRFEHDACGIGFVARVSGEADHDILRRALHAVSSLEHRGAVAADGASGDGAGVLTQIPRRLFEREAAKLGYRLSPGEPLGVGMVFFPRGAASGAERLTAELEGQGVRVVGWREVPLDQGALGAGARAQQPVIRQVLVVPAGEEAGFERALYLARKAFERSGAPGYVCSLSSRTLVYKALCVADELDRFYRDLADPDYRTAFAVYHQRYSTNTLPRWEMAQPFRFLAHNGEINTLWSNRAWMRVREAELPEMLHPLVPAEGSDSAALDGALELLTRNGRDLGHSLGILVPPAWEETGEELPPEVRAFYHSHAPLLEPWDGPAALAFSDGRFVGAALDRNGLRPCRYKVTADGLVVAGSEVGGADLDDATVVEKGRLGPGQMLLIDLEEGRLLHDAEIKHWLAKHHSAPRWTAAPLGRASMPADVESRSLARLQRLFGASREELQLVIPPMAEEGAEAIWSMGDDTPIAPLSLSPRSAYSFFRQRFAQVTNPAIDPLRETRVMSLRTWLGPRPSLFDESDRTSLFELPHPVLDAETCAALRAQRSVRVQEIDCTFAPAGESLEGRVEAIAAEAEAAVRGGAGLLVLSDRGAGRERAPVPLVLAVGATHHRLVGAGLRTRAGIVAEAGDCWDVHHLAVLVGCGATVVHPWMALASARAVNPDGGGERLVRALCAGLRKVMSKMGISTVASYRGGQLFEILGLREEVAERCFQGVPTRIGGLGFAELTADVLRRHRAAYADGTDAAAALPDFGRIRFRRADQAEHHAWQPNVVRSLQRGVGTARGRGGDTPDPAGWTELRRLGADAPPTQIRDLLDFVPAGPPVPLEEVEGLEAIVRRFVSSAMSLGALSPEAHRTLTVAMNRLGARSNSGEGGEDRDLYDAPGERADSKIKQVASGRFGVTAEYLARAEELEIKIAQGAKPGEGGQLPGHKVTDLIARLRHSQPGVTLISPPPHHDIYSIEDLAQLIYDLKTVNPWAAVGVKLVAQAGIGTVAAGVAKAYADYIVISGHSGGTGASPLSSIKNAGVPWELGLAEAQQVLVRNRLRGRVRLRVDGGLVGARDIVVAAMLGADEFGFGTAPLVAMGCDMARQCHKNSCPAGIATQVPELRARFRGTPEAVVRYFLHLAAEVRELLAGLGLRRLDELVGRVDLLRQTRGAGGLDLGRLLACAGSGGVRNEQVRNLRHQPLPTLDGEFVDAAIRAIEAGRSFSLSRPIRNCDRAVGARLSGEIALRRDLPALSPGTVSLRFTGSAGQSFGAFAVSGLSLILDGEANDHVGKGLSGGEIVLRPTGAARAASAANVILGNVALYGATAGRLFAAGRAGERFAVRNSGAVAVVEGVGDHACEYMTGGCVVVLGRTGWNFGAGMTGGMAYVFDPDGLFPPRLNGGTAGCERPVEAELRVVRSLVEVHVRRTGSAHAAAILREWEAYSRHCWRVSPRRELPVPGPEAVVTPDELATLARG